MLTWSVNSVITNLIGAEMFAITDKKFYVPEVNLVVQNYTKLPQPLNETND